MDCDERDDLTICGVYDQLEVADKNNETPCLLHGDILSIIPWVAGSGAC